MSLSLWAFEAAADPWVKIHEQRFARYIKFKNNCAAGRGQFDVRQAVACRNLVTNLKVVGHGCLTLHKRVRKIRAQFADVAELADAQVSEACDGDIVEVQVLSSAP